MKNRIIPSPEEKDWEDTIILTAQSLGKILKALLVKLKKQEKRYVVFNNILVICHTLTHYLIVLFKITHKQ